jgi:hypothetical protein
MQVIHPLQGTSCTSHHIYCLSHVLPSVHPGSDIAQNVSVGLVVPQAMCAISIPVVVLHNGIAGRVVHDSDLLRVGGPLSLVCSGALAIRVDKRAMSQPHISVPNLAPDRPGRKAEGMERPVAAFWCGQD